MGKLRVVKSKKEDDDNGLGRALYELSKLLLKITKETDPEYYAWLLKRDKALKRERLAREARLRVEKQRPEEQF